MREIRQSGSEGGGADPNRPFLPLSKMCESMSKKSTKGSTFFGFSMSNVVDERIFESRNNSRRNLLSVL